MPKWELVQSVVKAVDILEAVAESENGIRLNEIADRIGQKNTTVHNLVRTLAVQGILDKDSGNIYTLGQKLEELVNNNLNRKIYSKAVSVIKEFAGEIPQAVVVLAEKTRSDVILRLRISPDRPGIIQKPSDRSFFSYASVSSLIFMAFAETDMETVFSNYTFTEYGAHIWKSPEKLEEYIREVRRDGYAEDTFTNRNEFRFAVPVFNEKKSLIFALGIDFKNTQINKRGQEEIIRKAIEFSKRITNP